MKNKKLIKTSATLLTAIALLGPLVACQKQEVHNPRKDETFVSQVETTKQPQVEESLSLKSVKPTFKYENGNLKIDENSAMQIVKIALNDAQTFYESIGAPNMTYDKNLNVVNGKDNFYTDWMNEYFYLARAMSESSLRVDVKTELPSVNESGDTHAVGMMQLCENSIKSTLMQYYSSVFKENVNLNNLKIIPSENDINNATTSKEAQANIVQAVYNNIYLSICFDIYNAKCLNPVKHQDYYSAYGGFDEDIRKLATIGMYCSSRGTVINGLKNGNLEDVLRSNKHINTYLNNLDKFENEYNSKYNESVNAYQP